MVGCVPFCSHQLTSPPVEKSLKHLDTTNALRSAGVHITEQLRVDRLSGRFTWSRARQNEATDGPGGCSCFQLVSAVHVVSMAISGDPFGLGDTMGDLGFLEPRQRSFRAAPI